VHIPGWQSRVYDVTGSSNNKKEGVLRDIERLILTNQTNQTNMTNLTNMTLPAVATTTKKAFFVTSNA
jgi:hypothetical protein